MPSAATRLLLRTMGGLGSSGVFALLLLEDGTNLLLEDGTNFLLES